MKATSNIKVVNEFAAARDISYLFKGSVWSYENQNVSGGRTAPSWKISLSDDTGREAGVFYDQMLAGRLRLAPVNTLWLRLQQEFAPNHGLVEIYANGHPYGDDGDVQHPTSQAGHELTAIIIANTEWRNSWAGELLFYDEAHECIAIRPRPGRLILFDSSLSRAARAPSRECPELLKTLIFKMRPRQEPALVTTPPDRHRSQRTAR